MKEEMKHILFIVDGAADQQLAALQGRTALEAAKHPAMDALAAGGTLGMARTIPDGYPAGTDGAFLTLFGYTGGPQWSRGALEAAGLGLDTAGSANVLRCNLVSLSGGGLLLSHNGFDIQDKPAEELLDALLGDAELSGCLRALGARLLPGRGFRNLVAAKDPWPGFWPPHDHLGEPVPDAPPAWSAFLSRATALLQERSATLRLDRPVNALWTWGGGPAPALPRVEEHFGVSGDCVSAVPVVHGIARLAGLDVIDVPGATGRLDTDWRAKVNAALASPNPFTLLHLEAPDECAHEKDPEGKVRAIEIADAMLGALLAGLEAQRAPHRVLLMADHVTSTETGKHLADPVPFLLYDSVTRQSGNGRRFTEADAAASGHALDAAVLLPALLQPAGDFASGLR